MGIYSRPVVDRSAYVPRVVWVGDSIPYGVNNETLAGPREPMYFLGQAGGSGSKFYLAGSQGFPGNGDGLAVDPWCECYPGYALGIEGPATSLQTVVGQLSAYGSDIFIVEAGINDIITNEADSETVVENYSDYLDLAHSIVPRAQIVACTILKTLDATDTVAQAANALIPAMLAGKSYASQIFMVDIYASVARPVIGQGYADAVHLLDEGSEDLGTFIWENGFQDAMAAARGE